MEPRSDSVSAGTRLASIQLLSRGLQQGGRLEQLDANAALRVADVVSRVDASQRSLQTGYTQLNCK